MKIVLASDNQGKVKEIQGIFKDYPISLVPQSEFNVPAAEETGLSFVENALIKARHGAKHSGIPALADDSGLCVIGLNGQPGIYSARFAGINATWQDNIEKLLKESAHLAANQRKAFFYCAIAYVRDASDPIPLIAEGRWDGVLLTHTQGTEGFGYDPIFFIPELKCSAAELDAHHKNKISHRAKALSQFMQMFKEQYPQLNSGVL